MSNSFFGAPPKHVRDWALTHITEEQAFHDYAPDTAFEIDLSLIGTNIFTLRPCYKGLPRQVSTTKIDWGDGTVDESCRLPYYSEWASYTHTYPEIGKYIIRMNAVPFPIGTNYTDSHRAVTRVLRFADVVAGKDYTTSMFVGCPNIRTFEDGTLARWPDGVTELGPVYGMCTNLTPVELPEWPKTLTQIYRFYVNWWRGVYSCCNLSKIKNIPAWPAGLTMADYVYSWCTSLTGEIPAWPAGLTSANHTYSDCTHLEAAWTTDPAELMPSSVVDHADCVTGASASLRSLFYSNWGGTRAKET